jgi:hypothetical protein
MERDRGLSGLQDRPHHDGAIRCCGHDPNSRESEMTSQTQIHTIARQMLEQHGTGAIAQAAHALACEHKGETEEASEWRHIEDAIKSMRGPHQS